MVYNQKIVLYLLFFCKKSICGRRNSRNSSTVYQSLMVRSSGRPGHLRLLPDNEYDEDG